MEWCRQRKLLIIHQSSLAIISAEPFSSKSGGTWGSKLILPYEVSLSYFEGFLACSKILRHGANDFTSLWSKACCRFLSPLKIHFPRQGLNPRTLGPITITLTTILPRTTTAVQSSLP
jgi:hypothetical protein